VKIRLALLAWAFAGQLRGPAQAPAQVPAEVPDSTPPTLVQRYDLEHRIARFDLPGRLDEISGLAFSASGTLYGHEDERGIVFSIDPTTGKVGRGFELGSNAPRDDFEGIAVAGDRLFLISSRGRLYEFREAPQGGSSPVRVTDVGVGKTCEVEGLTYDPGSASLLLACKSVMPTAPEVRIHRIPLDPTTPVPPPQRIPLDAFASVGLGGGVHPSGMDIDPSTGNLVLVAAREEAILEIDVRGRVVSAHRFTGHRHPQAEGIAFGPDGLLYIADEGKNGKARLTVYGPPMPEGGS